LSEKTDKQKEETKRKNTGENKNLSENLNKTTKEKTENNHIKTPKTVKSLYYTSTAWWNEQKINQLLHFVKNTKINSVTIDIKEVDWYLAFDTPDHEFDTIKPISNKRIKNIKNLIKKLHQNNIYVIWRITVFKDKLLAEKRPDLAIKWTNKKDVWYDYKWNKYLDPYSKEVWDYIINISKVAYKLWFDEINYDYGIVRK